MILRHGAIGVGVVCVFLLVPAAVAPAAEIVPVNLTLVEPIGDINRMGLTLTVTIPILGTRNDTDTATVTGNVLANLTMDFDPVTHGGVVAGVEFTGGVFEISPLDFTLDYGMFVGQIIVNCRDTSGTLDTLLPPGSVTEASFPGAEHLAILNHGTMTIEGRGPVLGEAVPTTAINLADDPIAMVGQGTGTVTVSAPTVHDNMATYDVTGSMPVALDEEYTDPGTGVTVRIVGSSIGRVSGQFTRMLPPATLTWDGTDPGQWTSAHWTPGPVAPGGGEAVVVDSGAVTVSTNLAATPYASVAVAGGAPAGTVTIGAAGKLAVTGNVTVGAGGVLCVDGTLSAAAVAVTGGTVTNSLGGVGPMAVTGSVALADGATLKVEAIGAGLDKLASADTVTLGDNATLDIVIAGGEDNEFVSGTYTLIDADGGMSGTFADVTDLKAYVSEDVALGRDDHGLTYDETGGTVTLTLDMNLLPGDGNLDGQTDVSDRIIWNNNNFTFNTTFTTGDWNDDGQTDVSDRIVWNNNNFTFATAGAPDGDGPETAPTVAVPEPATLSLLALGGLVVLRPRRCRRAWYGHTVR